MSSCTDIKIDEKIKQKIAPPSNWKVVLLNDDLTPFDFVISLLIEVFNHTPDSAKNITRQVHETGSGIAGVYSFEVAETKSVESTRLARANGFPLQIKLDEE